MSAREIEKINGRLDNLERQFAQLVNNQDKMFQQMEEYLGLVIKKSIEEQ